MFSVYRWVAGPRQIRYTAAILCASSDERISGLEAAISDFQLPLWLHSIASGYVGLFDLENLAIYIAVGTALLCSL